MNFFINKIIINGSKNINKPIELIFSKKILNKKMDYSNSNIKAIYGPNGSGKSGIITAMYIYKRLLADSDGINDKLFSRFIYETINKETNYLSLDIVFSMLNEKKEIDCYRHKIIFTNNNENITISKEEIYKLSGYIINNEKFKPLVLISDGTITFLQTKKKNFSSEPIYINSLNLLDKHSVVSIIWKLIKNQFQNDFLENYTVIKSLFSILCLTHNMIVELNKEDIHFDYIADRMIEKNYDEYNYNSVIKQTLENLTSKEYYIKLSTNNRDIIDSEEYLDYEKNIKKLEEFIKIFKPNLTEIIIDKKIDGNKYYCDKILNYGGKKINIEFESTGIRKLVRLYSTLRACANGQIAFIDEFDANLHDVYFAKIIEFFKDDAKGQLCFTTHNLEPIEVLKNNIHSLDFVSNDSRIYSWTKNGNNSPLKKYVNGLIPYSPFNVESFSFDILLNEE